MTQKMCTNFSPFTFSIPPHFSIFSFPRNFIHSHFTSFHRFRKKKKKKKDEFNLWDIGKENSSLQAVFFLLLVNRCSVSHSLYCALVTTRRAKKLKCMCTIELLSRSMHIVIREAFLLDFFPRTEWCVFYEIFNLPKKIKFTYQRKKSIQKGRECKCGDENRIKIIFSQHS